jgi:Nucleotidyltransferase domain.
MKEEIVKAFLKVYEDDLVSLVLFGSYARGDQRKYSDIDLLVVLKKIEDRYEVFKKFLEVEKILEETVYKGLRERGYDPYVSPIFLDISQAVKFRSLYIDLVLTPRFSLIKRT